MPKGWKSNVYRTDLDEYPDGRFCAFFYDDDSANVWIDKQDEGTYEIRGKR